MALLGLPAVLIATMRALTASRRRASRGPIRRCKRPRVIVTQPTSNAIGKALDRRRPILPRRIHPRPLRRPLRRHLHHQCHIRHRTLTSHVQLLGVMATSTCIWRRCSAHLAPVIKMAVPLARGSGHSLQRRMTTHPDITATIQGIVAILCTSKRGSPM